MLLSERGIISTARIEGEQQARIEMAQRMKDKGFDTETISNSPQAATNY